MYAFDVDQTTQAPLINPTAIHHILNTHYGIKQGGLVDLTGYEDVNHKVIDIVWGEGREDKDTEAVLKITNPIEGKLDAHIDLQLRVCSALRRAGIPAVEVIKRLDGKDWDRISLEDVNQREKHNLPVRLFKVLPGETLETVPFTQKLVEELGEVMAKIHNVMDEFVDDQKTAQHLPYISPENRVCLQREVGILVDKGLLPAKYEALVMRAFADVPLIMKRGEDDDWGLIHSDLNETNVLVTSDDGEPKISGILDFGDMHFSLRAYDIAAAIIYLHLADKRQNGLENLINFFLAGYTRHRNFSEGEKLLPAMRARLSASLVYGLRTARINTRGTKTDYILKTQQNGWRILEELSQREGLLLIERQDNHQT